jgi:DNA-binding MarR family transcriptional regulator
MRGNVMLPDLLKYQSTWNGAHQYLGNEANTALAYLLILRTGNDLETLFAPFFERYHLSQGRFAVLMRLLDAPEQMLAPFQLADSLGVTRAAITKLLVGLEQNGLIERRLDPADRRAWHITLTTAARTLLEEILPPHFQQIRHIMSALTREEQDQLITLLLKLDAHLLATTP